MSQNGKGDRVRPKAISWDQWDENYARIDWSNWPPKQDDQEEQKEERRPTRSPIR